MDGKVSEDHSAVAAVVSGRVQGVGFRFSAQRAAQRFKLTGYVRNEMDGTVSVYYEGRKERVADFTAWLKKGPQGSRVNRVNTRSVQAKGCRLFEILF